MCSAWIGSGVARDLNDLRRVHQLLVSSLTKLHSKTNSTQLYNESMATLEKLSILKAWAEVFIVAMIGNGSAPASLIMKKLSSIANTYATTTTEQDGGDFGDFESQGESLLALVKPELVNLSQHWLAALKDHALLLLPSEFASQLPHDGGAFYTNDTMNSSKPHYLTSWPPILYAAALFLNDGGFETTDTDTSSIEAADAANANTTKSTSTMDSTATISHGSVSADRFHLIFGICMEALCSTRSSEKHESVVSCLQAVYTIFDSNWARIMLFKDKSLAVELCNVLHRLILTRDSLEVQLLCIEILKQTIVAAKEALDAERELSLANVDDNEQKTDLLKKLDLQAEGEESGDIVPGQSHVYAVLEVCLCLFVRQVPTMNPSATLRITPEQLQKQLKLNANGSFCLGDDNGMLVASAMQCLEGLTQLCSPQGAAQILPTILYLTTGIIKEIATKSTTDQTIIANTGTMQSALHCLKAVATDRYATDERCAAQWQKLLQSALGSIIDLTKTGCDETKVDEVTMMYAIAVFIRHTPANLISTPSLKFPCINHFRQCLQNESNLMVKLKCIQTMRSIFVSTDLKVATPYIHALAPRVIEALYNEQARYPKNDIELAIVLESIITVETLITLAEPQNRKFFIKCLFLFFY